MVVSRWYGGIKLGPDRFKHINNCARNALDKKGFIPDTSPQAKVRLILSSFHELLPLQAMTLYHICLHQVLPNLETRKFFTSVGQILNGFDLSESYNLRKATNERQ